jgi:hypothetical protein
MIAGRISRVLGYRRRRACAHARARSSGKVSVGKRTSTRRARERARPAHADLVPCPMHIHTAIHYTAAVRGSGRSVDLRLR